MGVRGIFQGGGSGFSSLWVSDDTPHGPGPGDFLEQGGPLDHRNIYVAALRWKLGVPPLGGGE